MPHPLPRPPIRSERAATVARWFRLTMHDDATPRDQSSLASTLADLVVPGTILLLTGASGSGKSRLLRAMSDGLARRGRRVVDAHAGALPDRPVVDCFDGLSLNEALRSAGRVGLGEAWSYLCTPGELSEGQRQRLRLALAMREATRSPTSRGVLVMDEFAAVLDRITAMVVARALRRIIDRARASAICATSHDDLVAALQPDIIVRCDFGRAHARWGEDDVDLFRHRARVGAGSVT